ncbi:MAG: ribosome recycling factor [Demequinaceae bacterium]|nr:ribosome recycling factor [Demequinaceae bacterium]
MIDDTLLEAEDKMDKAVETAKDDFATIRTGAASPAMFAKLLVDYYGAPTPLQQLASISASDARTIVISPYDRSAMGSIETALRASDLGVNPTDDGTVIRINMPQLTEERRKEYIKVARHRAEEARVAVRNLRRKAKDTIDIAVKEGDVGEDEGGRAEKELEGMTKRHTEAIDALLAHKENELLEV